MADHRRSEIYTMYPAKERDVFEPPIDANNPERSQSPRFPSVSEIKTQRSKSTPLLDLPHPSAFQRPSQTSADINHPRQRMPVSPSPSTSTTISEDQDDFRSLGNLKQRLESAPLVLDRAMEIRGNFSTYKGNDPTRPQNFSEIPRRDRRLSLPDLGASRSVQSDWKPRRKLVPQAPAGRRKSSSRRPSNTLSLNEAAGATPDQLMSKHRGRKKRESIDTVESGFSSSSGVESENHEDILKEPEADYDDEKNEKQENDDGIKQKEDGELKDEDLTWRPYDTFGTYEWEFDDDQTFREILKVIRCCLYGFLVLVLLLGTLASRISLFLLASDINQSKEARGESIVHLILCLCVPMLFNWIQAFMRILFGGKEWPNIKMFILTLSIELLSTFGMCLLLFRVLPSTDFFTGIVVTLSLFQVPSILKLFSQRLSCKTKWKGQLKIVCVFAAMIVQLGSPAYFLVTDFSTYKISPGDDHSQETAVNVTLFKNLGWQLPIALWLVSLSWWENYVPFSDSSRQFWKNFQQYLQETRDTSCVLHTPIKLGLVLLLARYLPDQTFSIYTWEPKSGYTQSEFYAIHFSLLCIILGSSILCTYLGGLACKLHMQRTAFAFPLMMSPPASLLFVYMQCRYKFLPQDWHTGTALCPNLDWENLREPLAVGAVLWLSYCVIVSQIWFPKVERMAKAERLFLTPHYHSIFTDFNLTLRRRKDKGTKKSGSSGWSKTSANREDGKPEEGKSKTSAADDKDVPTIYVCATMWHETKREMTQLLKSLFRLDYSHCASKLAQSKFNIRDPDFFHMEIHIFFDDAFELDQATNKRVPNQWVRQFIGCMEEAARSVVKGFIIIPSPIKVDTPYGGRLVWTMPGLNQLIVHMKDKNKIRHRKRWSQVMYMYYLLGFRMLGYGDGSHITEEDRVQHHNNSTLRHRKRKGAEKTKRKNLPFRQMLMRVNRHDYDELVDKSENTFILTLDGDIDFKPDSVKLLVDRMKKDKKVAAVCGRIHPIGSGPMVWYQQFEYAVSHWLQKAAEHVFGCVLCCPGCFSLFRASALMDDNVIKTYTTKPTEARHYIQFEQGEDRWLCTLLLQQGYRIDYSACADALTYAPESFAEFFNQRRRWSPSTLANIMDLLGSWRTTTRLNDNISRLYMLYQVIIMVSTIIAPSFLILMMTYSFQIVLEINRWWSYVLAIGPVAFYIFICLTKKNETQVKVGAVLAAVYAVVMMIISVSIIISIVEDTFGSPNVVFIGLLAFIFITASLLHPQEFFCILPGIIYFLTIPANFLLLTVFYLCNLNNVSWGTREVAKKSPEELKEIEARKAAMKKSWNIFSANGLKNIVDEIRDLVKTIWGLKKDLENQKEKEDEETKKEATASEHAVEADPSTKPGYEADPKNPQWLRLSMTGDGPVERINGEESEFWKFMIKKYLYPLDLNMDEKKKLGDDLRELRNNVVFICIMLNVLWTVIALQLQAAEERLKSIYLAGRYEPIAVIFLAIFAIILSLQFIGMLIHSWDTFLHFMASTHIDWFSHKHSEDEFARYVVQEVAKSQSLEPREDYDDDVSSDSSLNQTLESNVDDDPERHDSISIRTRSIDPPHNQNMFPDFWMRRPSNPGHFPRLEKILDHRLKMNKMSDRRKNMRRRGSWESNKSGSSGGHSDRVVSVLTGGNQRRNDRPSHFWNARNATMRHRFLQLQESNDITDPIIEEDEDSLCSVKVV